MPRPVTASELAPAAVGPRPHVGTGRRVLLYAAAWTPYLACYVAVFAADGRLRVGDVFGDAARNVGSAAALGAVVVWACRRLRWPAAGGPRRGLGLALARARVAAAHVGLAAAYTVAWWQAVVVLLTIKGYHAGEPWTPLTFGGPALRWQLFAGLMLYGTVAGVTYALDAARRLRAEAARAARAEAERARADALRAEAELQALRAKLDPHFLFNTLTSLVALVRYGSPDAVDALERFAVLLRRVLRVERAGGAAGADDVRLADEWAFVEDYLALERLRLGDRLRVAADLAPAALACVVPAFTLQPLVENAVRHAVGPRARGATVRVRAEVAGGELRLEVRDDGPGADPAAVAGAPGLGLSVVRRRLAARFGSGARLDVACAPGGGFAAAVRVPAVPAREASTFSEPFAPGEAAAIPAAVA